MLASAVGLVTALALLGWSLRHGDPSAAGLVLALANLALLFKVWLNQRRLSERLEVWMSAQLASAQDVPMLGDALQAGSFQGRGRSCGSAREVEGGPGPDPARVLH